MGRIHTNPAPTPARKRQQKKFDQSVLNEIRQLVSEGVSAREIAMKIGTTIGSLRVICSRHGITLRRQRDLESRAPNEVLRIPTETFVAFQAAAKLRKRPLKDLVSAVLDTVAKENLFEAVLGKTRSKSARVDRAASPKMPPAPRRRRE